MSDDGIISMPLTAEYFSRPIFRVDTGPRFFHHDGDARNGSCGIPLENIMPLLQSYPVSKIVHESPGLILNMLRLLVGPKPDGTKSELKFSENVTESFIKLLSLSSNTSTLVRTIQIFDPQFIPNFVTAILGVGPGSETSN